MSNVLIPITDDTPTSCHKKKIETIVSRGPSHMKGKYTIDTSNRLTSFDIKFITCPVVVGSTEFILSRNA